MSQEYVSRALELLKRGITDSSGYSGRMAGIGTLFTYAI